MKRFLVVLTILVLVAGFAFAESQISGKVTAAYTFNFADNAKSAGYAVKGSNAKLEWTWNSHTVGPYEGNKPYATVTVALSLSTSVAEDAAAGWNYDNNYEVGVSTAVFSGKLTLKEAKIVGEDWSIDLLKAAMYGEYAKSAWDYTLKGTTTGLEKDKPYTFDNTNGGKTNGVTVTIKDFSFGVGISELSWFDGERNSLELSSQSPVFKFDGGSAQAAAIVGFEKVVGEDEVAKFTFSFSAKADYALDAFAVSGAFDGRYANDEFNFDAAAKIAYAPATLDFYYASKTTTPKDDDALEKYMSIKATVDVAKIAENVPVTAFIGMKDVLEKNDNRVLLIGAEYTGEVLDAEASTAINLTDKDTIVGATVKAKKLVAGFGLEGGIDYFVEADEDHMIVGYVGANYTAEKFDVSADFVLGGAHDEIVTGFKASASSTKLVENAKLYANLALDKKGAVFAYDLLDLYRKLAVDGATSVELTGLGQTLTIGCEIAF